MNLITAPRGLYRPPAGLLVPKSFAEAKRIFRPCAPAIIRPRDIAPTKHALQTGSLGVKAAGGKRRRKKGGVGNDAFTKLLLHCNGTNGSQTITDSSASAHTVTAQGNAQIDTSQSKFGGASLRFDGSGDYLTIPNSADWNLGAVGGGNDFTIDLWIRYNSAPSANVTRIMGAASSSGWDLYHTGSTAYNFWTGAGQNATMSWPISTGVWYHFALVRSGTVFMSFQDGVKQGSNVAELDANNNGSALGIGADNSGNGPFDGWMDEIRISKGIARWTANFTPPSAPYG